MSTISGVTDVSSAQHSEPTVTANTKTETGIDFSSMIADAMKDEMTRMSVTARSDPSAASGGYMPMQMGGQGIEQMILAAASSGEVSDAQTALFMLCMMMQTSQDSDFSMVMQMMASMLTKIQDDAGSLRSSVMASGYDPYVLDTIDWNVFNPAMPGIFGAGQAALPLEFWRPTTPVVTSTEEDRSPERYRSVIAQFKVETAERYRPYRDGFTYCNIFMWDVTSAMGAEIPHYTDPNTGEPRYHPDVKGAKSMNARAIDAWLKTHGPDYGWREVDAETAQRYANEGKPAVTTSGNIDHVQVVCPSKDGTFDPIRGVTIAQAGRIVTSYTHISSTYSANTLKNNISYFVHD